MPTCPKHGPYPETNQGVDYGIGCPKCYEEECRRGEEQAYYDQTHCAICGAEFPFDKDAEEPARHCWVVHELIGDGEDWDDERDEETRFCPECYETKFKPLLEGDSS